MSNFLFTIFFQLFLLVGGYLLYNIVVVFVIHWHESAMDLHVFPIPIPHFYTSLLSYFIYRQSEIHSLLILGKGILIAPLDQRDHCYPPAHNRESMCCKSTRTYLLMICPLSALYNKESCFLKSIWALFSFF